MCQIYSKLTIKTPEQCYVLLLLMNIAAFEQINLSWACETIVSDNKLIFSNYGKYIVLWAGKIWLAWLYWVLDVGQRPMK